MKTTLDYLKEAKATLGIESDYALAKWLKMSTAAVSQWKTGKRIIDDYTAAKIAQVLGVPAIEVIAAANWEREKDEKRKRFWQDFSRATVGGSVGLLLLLTGAYNEPSTAAKLTKYTLCAQRKGHGV